MDGIELVVTRGEEGGDGGGEGEGLVVMGGDDGWGRIWWPGAGIHDIYHFELNAMDHGVDRLRDR